MLDPHTPAQVPDGYREVLYWKLGQHPLILIAINLAGFLLLFPVGAGFFSWAGLWHGHETGSLNGMIGIPSVVIGIMLVLVLHELVHGLVMQHYGAKPRYGVIWKALMFYATAPGYAFRRDQYTVIALAPLVILSILGVLLIALPLPAELVVLIALCATANFVGAAGDMYLTSIALRYPSRAYIVDEKDGMRVFMPAEELP